MRVVISWGIRKGMINGWRKEREKGKRKVKGNECGECG